ncbi:hypothetical protein B566_EDAN006711 [Ephemera danica]|nr:hypothetical protein B566_EDAN006711 [Ephemera danica]
MFKREQNQVVPADVSQHPSESWTNRTNLEFYPWHVNEYMGCSTSRMNVEYSTVQRRRNKRISSRQIIDKKMCRSQIVCLCLPDAIYEERKQLYRCVIQHVENHVRHGMFNSQGKNTFLKREDACWAMLVLGLCLMMKLLEYSSGHVLLLQEPVRTYSTSSTSSGDVTPPPRNTMCRTRRKRRKYPASRYFGPAACCVERAGVATAMSGAASLCGEAGAQAARARLDPDLLNSNQGDNKDSFISNASSQDFDNSDYQWFLDYGDTAHGGSAAAASLLPTSAMRSSRNGSQPTSVFSSSMSLSLGGPHDFSYDDIAKNLDANLAEIDMEDFRTEDIHSILTLPTMCCGDLQTTNGHGEMIASVSGSLIAKLDAFDDTTSSVTPHSTSQEESGSGTEMSICKSELLFSPVKESATLMLHAGANISVDSLDCELDGGDLLLTCQANKDNYTIAFEGSVALCSEGDSDYHDTTDNRQQQAEFEDSLLRPNLLRAKLITEDTELTGSELECSTRFYPVSEQNNTRNQEANNKQRNVDVINNVFVGPKPSNFNNNNNNDVQRKCHGTQTKRINGSPARLTCSIDAVQPNQQRTTDVEIRSSPGPRRKAGPAAIATMKNVATQIPVHVIDQGIQTSSFADVNAKSPFQLLESPNKTSVVKTITPNIKPKPRSQSATTTPEDTKKPIYVYYPNYTLPDLTFLREKQENFDANVFLVPQKYKLPSQPKRAANRKLRPFSCNDVETLKKKGLSHIQDWESLNVLLPQEFKKLLEETEDSQKCEYPGTTATSSFSSTATQPSSGYRGSSTNLTDSSLNRGANYSPLYVYRYDSAGSDSSVFKTPDKSAPPLPKRSISLSEDKVPPPRPPLPRGILRKDRKSERHSTPDIGRLTQDLLSKRLSLHDPYVRVDRHDIDEGVDLESSSGGENKYEARPPTPPLHQKKDILNNNAAPQRDEKEMLRLRSQVSHFLLKKQQPPVQQVQETSLEHSGDSAIKKSVSFAPVVGKDAVRPPTELLIPPPNSPNSHHVCVQRLYQGPQAAAGEAAADECSPLLEEILSVAPEGCTATRLSLGTTASNRPQRPVLVDLNQKRELVCAVKLAVDQIMSHYSRPLQESGDAGAHHLALQVLCPALLALLTDSLRTQVDTVFGPVPNSAWRVVEASAQQGQVSKALNDLVMRLNSDDLLTEGLLKFNAFIFGLLNVHSLDAWINYLRTRESVLQKHYDPNSFMFLSNSATRSLFDQLVTIIEPLSLLPFKLDLLYERKVLEYSLQRLGQDSNAPISPTGLKEWTRKLVRSIQSSLTQSYEEPTVISNSLRKSLAEETVNFVPAAEIPHASPVEAPTTVKQRPRSCIDAQQSSFSLTDIASTMKKRWSGIQLGSKLFQAFDKLTTEETDEEYTDSLDQPRRKVRQSSSSNNSTSDDNNEIPRDNTPPVEETKTPTISGEDKFRRLQMKWELLSGKDGKPISAKSRIPRLVSSPVRPTAPLIPTAQTQSVQSRIPMKKAVPSTGAAAQPAKGRQLTKPRSLSRESSHQDEKPRQQSLPPPRRTAAMLQRPTPTRQPTRTVPGAKLSKPSATVKPKQRPMLDTHLVQTLCHRLPSDSGHLSFNEGEVLTVVLEVDNRWLLCCRGNQKGLVPRDDIIFLDTSSRTSGNTCMD